MRHSTDSCNTVMTQLILLTRRSLSMSRISAYAQLVGLTRRSLSMSRNSMYVAGHEEQHVPKRVLQVRRIRFEPESHVFHCDGGILVLASSAWTAGTTRAITDMPVTSHWPSLGPPP